MNTFIVITQILIAILGLMVITQLISLKIKLITMSQEFDDLKAKVQAQRAVLDTVSTNVTGIGKDVDFLKKKIEDLTQAGDGGATKEELQELSELVDGTSAKITAINDATKQLDDSTDSSGQTETPAPTEDPGTGDAPQNP